MMTPYYLRKRLPTAKIGFFLHIPWPSSEIYRSLPVRDQVLTGLLASDIIGFQSFAYARHFMSCCTRILGLKVNDRGILLADGRMVRIEVMPIGIDSEYWINLVSSSDTQKSIQELKTSFQGKKIIASRYPINHKIC
jgi:trehalose 6-phosphate synthase/phosphatase